ncbi:enoyl-CoA hydratase/isomerase family protein [Microbacterium suaedae]|uniref:enoyl-CoA hydratase/isomerase family protein n=1 Tax=Microbacterium suaedae TaxID=2067813 RepID=UPI0013A65036|nr:enoyl-CoA hydratase-related protein [Microbacterium suaedae]
MTGLRTDVSDGIGTITLARPKALNALTSEVTETLAAQIRAWEASASVDVVIVTGEGDRAFAAGADIPELRSKSGIEMTHRGMQHAISTVRESTLPTLAAVNGLAFGGGFELALACDVRIAVPRATFALPETGLGIIPGAGGTQMLTRIAGPSVASHLILTGAHMRADRAYELGIVSSIHEPEDLEAAAIELAQAMRGKGPRALRLAKAAIAAAHDTSMSAGLQIELLAQAVLFETADRDEGMDAFLERRQPHFDGEVRHHQ